MSLVWKVRLAAQAELDFSEIITWTLENFGERQADTYAETPTLAIEALHGTGQGASAAKPALWLLRPAMGQETKAVFAQRQQSSNDA